MKSCDCISKINESLQRDYPGAKLETGFSFPSMQEKLYIPFEWQPAGKKRKKLGTIVTTFCPFCGKKYE